MRYEEKTREQLIEELVVLRQGVAPPSGIEEPGSLDRRRTRREVRHRLRDAVAQMQSPDDIQRILLTLKEGMQELRIPFQGCGINFADPEGDAAVVSVSSLVRDGRVLPPAPLAWGEDRVRQTRDAGLPVYRRDLEVEDPDAERQLFLEHFGHPVRSVLDVPFAFGTLAINSEEPNAFSPDDVADLEHSGIVLEESYRRWKDLGKLEQRNRQLQKEITERKQGEQALLQSSRLIALGQMAAGMAHELNQPLTVISAMAEGLQIRLEQGIEMTPERLEKWSNDVIGSVDRLSSTIEHLRAFSRDRADEPDTQVSLSDVVQDSLSLTQAQLKVRGIEVALSLTEDLAPLTGDQYRLEQVLINLIHNGRDAVEERQEQMSDSDEENWQMRLDIRSRQEQDQVVLEVEDNGIGMGEEARLQVLEPFYTTKSPDRGTGLGLSISHAIVRDHGGEIECESTEGEGTVFRVRLPIIAEPSATGGS